MQADFVLYHSREKGIDFTLENIQINFPLELKKRTRTRNLSETLIDQTEPNRFLSNVHKNQNSFDETPLG